MLKGRQNGAAEFGREGKKISASWIKLSFRSWIRKLTAGRYTSAFAQTLCERRSVRRGPVCQWRNASVGSRQRREKQLIAEGTLFIYFVGNFFYKEGVHFYLLFR